MKNTLSFLSLSFVFLAVNAYASKSYIDTDCLTFEGGCSVVYNDTSESGFWENLTKQNLSTSRFDIDTNKIVSPNDWYNFSNSFANSGLESIGFVYTKFGNIFENTIRSKPFILAVCSADISTLSIWEAFWCGLSTNNGNITLDLGKNNKLYKIFNNGDSKIRDSFWQAINVAQIKKLSFADRAYFDKFTREAWGSFTKGLAEQKIDEIDISYNTISKWDSRHSIGNCSRFSNFFQALVTSGAKDINLTSTHLDEMDSEQFNIFLHMIENNQSLQSLNVSMAFKNSSDEQWQQFFQAIHTSSINAINLSGNNLPNSFSNQDVWYEFTKILPQLKKIAIDGFLETISDSQAQEFAEIVNQSSLELLDISGEDLKNISDSKLNILLSTISNSHKLKTLIIADSKFGELSVEKLKIVMEAIKVSGLERLKIDGKNFSSEYENFDWQAFWDYINLSNIKQLYLNDERILSYYNAGEMKDEFLAGISKSKLETLGLSLGVGTEILSQDFTFLANVIKSTAHTPVKSLVLKGKSLIYPSDEFPSNLAKFSEKDWQQFLEAIAKTNIKHVKNISSFKTELLSLQRTKELEDILISN